MKAQLMQEAFKLLPQMRHGSGTLENGTKVRTITDPTSGRTVVYLSNSTTGAWGAAVGTPGSGRWSGIWSNGAAITGAGGAGNPLALGSGSSAGLVPVSPSASGGLVPYTPPPTIAFNPNQPVIPPYVGALVPTQPNPHWRPVLGTPVAPPQLTGRPDLPKLPDPPKPSVPDSPKPPVAVPSPDLPKEFPQVSPPPQGMQLSRSQLTHMQRLLNTISNNLKPH